MVVDLELIQFYRATTLKELLLKATRVCEFVGFPFLSLTWSPAPGPTATMISNHTLIWDNFSERLGHRGEELNQFFGESLAIALAKSKSDTRTCQTWTTNQKQPFQMIAQAPSDFYLTRYQRQLVCAFGESEWTEFCAVPLCRERDRVLVLVAKTQSAVTKEMMAELNKTLAAFASAYRCLHSNALSVLVDGVEASAEATLSRREVECLQWLASGKTLSEAATILGISERTLRFHVTNARQRLGVSTTVQAIVMAALMYGFDPHDTRRSVYTAARSQMR